MKTSRKMSVWVALAALVCVPLLGSVAMAAPYFTATPTSGRVPLYVTFVRAGITGTPDSMRWDFGDGTYLAQQPYVAGGAGDSARHTFVAVGYKTPTMHVFYPGPIDSSLALTNYISVLEVDFSGAPLLEGPGPLIVTFTSMSGLVIDSVFRDSVTWHRWPSYKYKKGTSVIDTFPVGVYTDSMWAYYRVRDPNPPKASNNYTYEKARPSYITSAVDFAIRPPTTSLIDTMPITMYFGGAVVPTTGSGGVLDSIRWMWGDGDTTRVLPAGLTPYAPIDSSFTSHKYVKSDTFTVKLKAWYDNGTSFERVRTQYVTVRTPYFTGTPTSGLAPLTVNFTGWAKFGYDSITWNFGEPGYGSGKTPSHVYNNPGTYSVTMTAWYTPDPDFPVTRTAYIVVKSGGQFTNQASEVIWFVPPLNQDSCTSWTYRGTMLNWLQMAGPNSKKRPVLTIGILNPTYDDTVKTLTVTSFIEKSNSVNRIYLFRDNGDSVSNAGDTELKNEAVLGLFQTNDQFTFTGINDIITAGTPAYYHILVDIDSSHVAPDTMYNGLGVTVHIKGNDVSMGRGGLGPVGSHPFGIVRNGCYPAKPNGYALILDAKAPTCATVNYVHGEVPCDNACDNGVNTISLGDSLLIQATINAGDSMASGWPKVYLKEFSAFSAPVTMKRNGTYTYSYVNAVGPDYLNIPTTGIVNPIDVIGGQYWLIVETKDTSGNIGRCSTLVAEPIDTKKPAVAGRPASWTLLTDHNGNGIVNPGDTIQFFIDMSNEVLPPVSEKLCRATVLLHGWYPLDSTFALSDTAGDGKFYYSHVVGNGILQAAAGSQSAELIVWDNACNRDSLQVTLANAVDNQRLATGGWTMEYLKLLDLDSNGCLGIGDQVRVRVRNATADTDLAGIYCNLLEKHAAALGPSRQLMTNLGSGTWQFDWTIGEVPQDSANDLAAGQAYVTLYATDLAGNEDTVATGKLAYAIDSKYPRPVDSLRCESVKNGVIKLFWANPDPDWGKYYIYFDNGTGTINYTTPLAVYYGGLGNWWTTDGTIDLVHGKTYIFDVWTVDNCSNIERKHPTPVACIADKVAPKMCITQPDTGKVYCQAPSLYACPKGAEDKDVASVTLYGRLAGTTNPWIGIGSSSASDIGDCFSVPLNPSQMNVIVPADSTKSVEIIAVGTDFVGNERPKDSARADCSPVFHLWWSNAAPTGTIATINGLLPIMQPYCGVVGWTLSGATNTVAITVTGGNSPYTAAVYVTNNFRCDSTYDAEMQEWVFDTCWTLIRDTLTAASDAFNLNVAGYAKGHWLMKVVWSDGCKQTDTKIVNLCIGDQLAPCAEVTWPVDGKCIRRSRSTQDPVPISVCLNQLPGKNCTDQNDVLKIDYEWATSCCVGTKIDTTGWSYFTKPKGSVSPGTQCDTIYFPPPFQAYIQKIVCAGVDTIEYVLDSTAITTSCAASWNLISILPGDSSNGGYNCNGTGYTVWWVNTDALKDMHSGDIIYIRARVHDKQGNVDTTACVKVCIDVDTPPLCLASPDTCDNGRLSGNNTGQAGYVTMTADLNWPQGNIDDIENVFLYYKKDYLPDVPSSWTEYPGPGKLGNSGTNSTVWRWEVNISGIGSPFDDMTYYDFRVIAKTTSGLYSYDYNGDHQFDAGTFDLVNCDAKKWFIDKTTPKVAVDTVWTHVNGNLVIQPNVSCGVGGCDLSDPRGWAWTQYGQHLTVQPFICPLAEAGEIVKTEWRLVEYSQVTSMVQDGRECGCPPGQPINGFVLAIKEGSHALDTVTIQPTDAPFVHVKSGTQTFALQVTVWDACGNHNTDCVQLHLLDVDTTEVVVTYPHDNQVFCNDSLRDGGITVIAEALMGKMFSKVVFAYRPGGTTTWVPFDSVDVYGYDVYGPVWSSRPWYASRYGLANGTYELTAWGVDNAGNRQTKDYPVTVHLSCAPPTVTLTAPVADAFIGCAETLTATAADTTSAKVNSIVKVAFYVSKVTKGDSAKIGEDDYSIDGTFAVDWNPHVDNDAGSVYIRANGDGGYYIWAVATNKAGQSTSSKRVWVKYDGTKPRVDIAQVNGDRSDNNNARVTLVTPGTPIQIYAFAADDQSPRGDGPKDNSGIDSVVASIESEHGGEFFHEEKMTPVPGQPGYWTITWPTAGLPTGHYHIYVKAWDKACNEQECGEEGGEESDCWSIELAVPQWAYIAGFGVSSDRHMNHTYKIYAQMWPGLNVKVDSVVFQAREGSGNWINVARADRLHGEDHLEDGTFWWADWNPCPRAAEFTLRVLPYVGGTTWPDSARTVVVTMAKDANGVCVVSPKTPSGVLISFLDRLENGYDDLALVDVRSIPSDKHLSMIGVYADITGGLTADTIGLSAVVYGDMTWQEAVCENSLPIHGGTGTFWAAYNDGLVTHLRAGVMNIYPVQPEVRMCVVDAQTKSAICIPAGTIGENDREGIRIFPSWMPGPSQDYTAWAFGPDSMATAIKLHHNCSDSYDSKSQGYHESGDLTNPVELEISYDVSAVNAKGLDSSFLAVARWNGSEWDPRNGIVSRGVLGGGKAKFYSWWGCGVYAVVSLGSCNSGAITVRNDGAKVIVKNGSTDILPPRPEIYSMIKSNIDRTNNDIDHNRTMVVLDGKTTLFNNGRNPDNCFYESFWDDETGILYTKWNYQVECNNANGETNDSYTIQSAPPLTEGTHTLYVQAYNDAGYCKDNTYSFNVDATKPDVKVVGMEVCPNPTFTIQITDRGGAGVNWDSVFVDVYDITGSQFSVVPKKSLIHTESPDAFIDHPDSLDQFDKSTGIFKFTLHDHIAQGRRLKIVIYDGIRHEEYSNDCNCEFYDYRHVTDGVPDLVGNHTQIVEEDYTVQGPCGGPGGETKVTFDATDVNSKSPFDPWSGEYVSFALNGFDGGGQVTVKVYDLAGEEVMTLFNDVTQGTVATVKWDGRNGADDFVAQGVYLVHFSSKGGVAGGPKSQVIKVVVKRK